MFKRFLRKMELSLIVILLIVFVNFIVNKGRVTYEEFETTEVKKVSSDNEQAIHDLSKNKKIDNSDIDRASSFSLLRIKSAKMINNGFSKEPIKGTVKTKYVWDINH